MQHMRTTKGINLVFVLGLMWWCSGVRKGKVPGQSEYYAADSTADEIMKQLLKELGYEQGCVTVYCDNQALSDKEPRVPQTHQTHPAPCYSWICQASVLCPTQKQAADLFTKGLSASATRSHLQTLCLVVSRVRMSQRRTSWNWTAISSNVT